MQTGDDGWLPWKHFHLWLLVLGILVEMLIAAMLMVVAMVLKFYLVQMHLVVVDWGNALIVVVAVPTQLFV